MKYAIFADVHGNEIALDAFLKEVSGTVDGYICLGDTVGYGPDNDSCLEKVFALPNIVALTGNHEYIFHTKDLGMCSQLAQKFFDLSVSHFSRHDLITDLPAKLTLAGWTFCHTLRHDARWLYLYDERKFPDSMDHNLCIAHTHYQKTMQVDAHRVVNVGSIGQNRANKKTMCWGVLDEETRDITLYQKPYDLDLFTQRLQKAEYPEELIAYYRQTNV